MGRRALVPSLKCREKAGRGNEIGKGRGSGVGGGVLVEDG